MQQLILVVVSIFLFFMWRVGFGQDSHAFVDDPSQHKKMVLAGVVIPDHPGFAANSDGDVIFHAVTNAVSSLTTRPILGPVADALCKKGITQSVEYLKVALADLSQLGAGEITQVSVSLEMLSPKIFSYLPLLRRNLASVMAISETRVGITAHSGEGLTAFGQGKGALASAVVTWHALF